MKGDFSRQTFHSEKHYSGVLMQQGRVQVDADWNEQREIVRHRAETEAADVVGAAGAPQTAPGFALTPTGGGADLQIAPGRFYVDGILCENEAAVPFSAQPDLLPIDGPLLPAADGLYVAFLEVWERHVTALEDPAVKESALGGPDTATRTKTVWQVRLLQVTDPGGTPAPDAAFPEWTALLRANHVGIPDPGRLAARSSGEEPSPDPLCVLPPFSGYRRLENQLYRVEIHTGGDRAHARFKWSRDNGTVASALEADEDGDVVDGTVVRAAELGRDGVLTFASDPLPQWLEITDDRYELRDQHGQLAQVQGVDPATREITFAPNPLIALDAAQRPLVRRWDQTGDVPDGVAMTGDWQELEDGVQVAFSEGVYRSGDYWLIPARTAVGLETGHVEWPLQGGAPLPLAAGGTQHHFARLALVRRSGGAWALVGGGDARRRFPPLTAIAASDVSYSGAVCRLGDARTVQQALDVICQSSGSIYTLLLGPGDDIAAAIAGLGAGVQDMLIGLRGGTYPLTAPVRIDNRQSVQIVGIGPGTRLAATGEVALWLTNCANVRVSNLAVTSGALDTTGIGGAITAENCGVVSIADVVVSCPGGPYRGGSCLTVRGPGAAESTARIHACELRVGHQQTGVQLINVDRVRVTENWIRAGDRPASAQLLQDAQYRGLLRRHLIAGLRHGGDPPPDTNATVTMGANVVHFRTDPSLVHGARGNNDWQSAVNSINPGGINSPRALGGFLLRLASGLLANGGTGQGGTPPLRSVIAAVTGQDFAAAEQGIVVSGTESGDIRILHNTITGVVKGIHVALGARRQAFLAGAVAIEDNTIGVALPTSATRGRHAIFVGPANSVVASRNYVTINRAAQMGWVRMEGMRLFGVMGRRVIVRENHIGPGTSTGISFAPLNVPVPASALWMITENLTEAATTKVDVPQRGPGHPGVPDPAGVRARILGLANNFA